MRYLIEDNSVLLAGGFLAQRTADHNRFATVLVLPEARGSVPARFKYGKSLKCVGYPVAEILKGKEPLSQPWAKCIVAKPHLDRAERCRLLMVGMKVVSHCSLV